MRAIGMREGFDVGLEMSGAAPAFRDMIDKMNNGGKIAILGIAPAGFEIDWNKVIFKMLTLKGIYGREMFETWYKMIALVQSGLDVSPLITHRIGDRRLRRGLRRDALRHLRQGGDGLVLSRVADPAASGGDRHHPSRHRARLAQPRDQPQHRVALRAQPVDDDEAAVGQPRPGDRQRRVRRRAEARAARRRIRPRRRRSLPRCRRRPPRRCGGSPAGPRAARSSPTSMTAILRPRRSAAAASRAASTTAPEPASAGTRATSGQATPDSCSASASSTPSSAGSVPRSRSTSRAGRARRRMAASTVEPGRLLERPEALEAPGQRVGGEHGPGEADEAGEPGKRGVEPAARPGRRLRRHRGVQHPRVRRDRLLLGGDLVQPGEQHDVELLAGRGLALEVGDRHLRRLEGERHLLQAGRLALQRLDALGADAAVEVEPVERLGDEARGRPRSATRSAPAARPPPAGSRRARRARRRAAAAGRRAGGGRRRARACR